MRRGLFLYISLYFVDLLFKMPKKNSSSNTTRLDKMAEKRIKCTIYSLFDAAPIFTISSDWFEKRKLSGGNHVNLRQKVDKSLQNAYM